MVQTNIEIPTALRMMTKATDMPYVFELGGSGTLYGLQLLGRGYLTCLNLKDTKKARVTSAERWEPDNLREVIGDTPLLSLTVCPLTIASPWCKVMHP